MIWAAAAVADRRAAGMRRDSRSQASRKWNSGTQPFQGAPTISDARDNTTLSEEFHCVFTTQQPDWHDAPGEPARPCGREETAMKPSIIASVLTFVLLTIPGRADVIMDWNAKADAIGIEKQLLNSANA